MCVICEVNALNYTRMNNSIVEVLNSILSGVPSSFSIFVPHVYNPAPHGNSKIRCFKNGVSFKKSLIADTCWFESTNSKSYAANAAQTAIKKESAKDYSRCPDLNRNRSSRDLPSVSSPGFSTFEFLRDTAEALSLIDLMSGRFTMRRDWCER